MKKKKQKHRLRELEKRSSEKETDMMESYTEKPVQQEVSTFCKSHAVKHFFEILLTVEREMCSSTLQNLPLPYVKYRVKVSEQCLSILDLILDSCEDQESRNSNRESSRELS